jgi:hypothetical protein
MVLAVVLLAGCTGSDEPNPTPADPTAVYLDGLSELVALIAEAGKTFELLLGPVFPDWAPDDVQQSVLLNALREEDLAGTMQEIARRVEELDPPDELEADHSVLTSKLADQVRAADEIATAIEDGNLPKIHLLKAELDSSFISSFLSVSSKVCHAAFANSVEQLGCVCQPIILPGGEYGRSIDSLSRKFLAEFCPRVSFAEGLSEDQLLEALSYVQPAIVALFDNIIGQLQQIAPPAEYEAGHQVLLDYFTELRSTAIAIDRAVVERDESAVSREFTRSGDIASSADDRMPDNYRPLVVQLFGEP